MRFISYRYRNQTAAGLLVTGGVLPLAESAGAAGESADLSSVLAVIRGGEPALAACARLAAAAPGVKLLPRSEVQLLAPVPEPVRNIFCVGRNYVDHVKEGFEARQLEVKLPEVPQFFTKATHAVIGPDADVRLDRRVTQKLDYEVELAVVIGRGGRDIAREAAFEHVFGYTIANDITARDLQRRHDQWFKGKALDSSLPLGPCLVTRDEIHNPRALELTLEVNGEQRQRARVEQMIFDIPAIIASLSAGLTLDAGDIISTGTPSGVGFAMTPPHYLRDGDEVLARIDGIGELRNRIVEVREPA